MLCSGNQYLVLSPKPPLWLYMKPSCCFPMKKTLTISIFHPLSLSGCSKQSPKPPCLAPEKNLLIPDPLNIPHIICLYFFLHLFAVSSHLNQNCGRPPWFSHPHAESLGLCRNTLALLRCCSPASGGSKSPQPSSQHFGNQREHIATWGLFVFTM